MGPPSWRLTTRLGCGSFSHLLVAAPQHAAPQSPEGRLRTGRVRIRFGFGFQIWFGFGSTGFGCDSDLVDSDLVSVYSLRIWLGRSRYDSIRIRFGFVWESVRLGFDLEFGLEFGLGFGLGFGTTCRKITFL